MKQRFIEEFSARHGLSTGAAESLVLAVSAGNGTMAQFSHPELGGMGQWARGGMIMIGDMFNQGLKYRIDALCTEISAALMENPALTAEIRTHGSSGSLSGRGSGWPKEFGHPSSSGAQNDLSYAFFPSARRLVIEKAGAQAIYDTGEHVIAGVSQQQGSDQSLSFSSQFGSVRLADLVRIDGAGQDTGIIGDGSWNESPSNSPPTQWADLVPASEQSFVPVANSAIPASADDGARSSDDIFTMIERLAELHSKGILSDEEFAAKKIELLTRL
ncbi:putative oligomerization/nucleic acid binding protein [Ancylobacter aquaticus]|uniref:Putative oligomerization/nucleic acid binding protein n=1 Tax=Ancylobacter aquaticus TaxID=100 RepID=A0A4R1HR01_ANCAQ|nr:SHOCT domain-containing protein [Ancylobacter aquaticus]TCK19782.1 putative oligomerization/nucleic acid binding protein [Ancylobacter aquaticus]